MFKRNNKRFMAQLEQLASLAESFGVFDAAVPGEDLKGDFTSKILKKAESSYNHGIEFVYTAVNVRIVVHCIRRMGQHKVSLVDVTSYPWNSAPQSDVDCIGLNVAMNTAIGAEPIGQIRFVN